jgi:uncharacterized protein (TIGR02147 family)
MPDIFRYTSYARFIKDYYLEKKKENSRFSYETFARKAGFKTRSYLIEVASGKKEISKASLYNIARAMDLNSKQTEYFEALIGFQQATTFKEKEFHFSKMGALSGVMPGRILEHSQYAYFSEWWHPVVRELVCLDSFKGDFVKLAKSLLPSITARQARESVELLLDLGLLVKVAAGRFRQVDASVRTEDDLTSFVVLKYQKDNLRLADEALDHIPTAERDISTLTAAMSPSCFAVVKKEMQAFRSHLIKLIENDRHGDRIYQFNLQLFPVSNAQNGEK